MSLIPVFLSHLHRGFETAGADSNLRSFGIAPELQANKARPQCHGDEENRYH